MKYTLGFKSGNSIEVDVKDGKEFTNNVLTCVKQNPSALAHWYTEPGFIFIVSELEFMAPSDMIEVNKQKK